MSLSIGADCSAEPEENMGINRLEAQEKFAEYVRNYNEKDEKIRLKIEHTYQVAELCEKIALSEHLSKEDTDLAWLIGLLHDIGRFEQLRRFHTFLDAQSIDHAAFGANLLFHDKMIDSFLTDRMYDRLIEDAVRTHSMYRLPAEFDGRTQMFCNIIRDADKIDIMRVNVQTPLEEIYNVSTEKLRNDEISEEVMNSFYEEHATLRTCKKTSVDHLAGHISLVYELVYPFSIQEADRQGFLHQMMDFKSDRIHTQKQFKIIREKVNQYLARKK